MNINPEIEVIYSGELNVPSDSNLPANPRRLAVGARRTTAEARDRLDETIHHESFGSSNEPYHS